MSTELSALMRVLQLRPISVPPIYKILTGSYSASVLLAQILYWYSKMGREFYKTDMEFAADLYMGIKEFRTAKAKMKNIPFVKIVKRGVPQMTWYSINFDLYLTVMKRLVSEVVKEGEQIGGDNGAPNLPQSVQTEISRMVQTEISRSGQTITESTSESTTNKDGSENSEDDSAPKKKKPKASIIPSDLDVARREILEEWIEYRKERRSPIRTAKQVERILKEWEKFSDAEIKEAVNKSIVNGYIGCFPAKGHTGKYGKEVRVSETPSF